MAADGWASMKIGTVIYYYRLLKKEMLIIDGMNGFVLTVMHRDFLNQHRIALYLSV